LEFYSLLEKRNNMKKKGKIIFPLIGVLFTLINLSGQIYPTNFLWNGCSYMKDGFISSDTLKCRELSYKLVFEDNFDSTALNANFWQTLYPWGRSLHSDFSGTGWERQFYTDDNVSVNSGYLHLKTKLDPGYRSPDPVANNIFFNYTSGMVYSTLDFKKGKFEIRCKIPSITGMFPAFWLYGHCGQEIDIFEFTNASEISDPKQDAGHVIMTYHKQYDCSDSEKGLCSYGLSRNYDTDLSTDFHNYSVEWNEYKIVWKLDGEIAREVYKYWTISPQPPEGPLYGYAFPSKACTDLNPSTKYTLFEPFPSTDQSMHIIINNAVLKERASQPGALPQEFLIDYVRAYEEIEGKLIGKTVDPSGLNLFPNPTSGSFSFMNSIDGNLIAEITVLNVFGSSVDFYQVSNGNNITIKLVNEIKGIYYVQVRAGAKYYFSKLVFN
jgi:hypothetical protein